MDKILVKRASIITILIIFNLLGGWYYFVYPYVKTNDARVAMTLSRISPIGEGGRIEKINFTEGTVVEKDEVLIELDSRVAQAQYDRALAKAKLSYQEFQRMSKLAKAGSGTIQSLEVARSNSEISAAELKIAKAALENTSVRAPFNGVIVQKTTELGNHIEGGQSAAILADWENAWIAANIDETEVGRVKLGQPVEIYIDEGGSILGAVSEIRSATANSFALIPTDNGAGNFIKLQQRIPIKISIPSQYNYKLRAGQSAEIKIKIL